MLTADLQSIFGFEQDELLHENPIYGFSIHLLSVSDNNYNILYTKGLANNLQDVDENNTAFKSIELYICLPDFWNLDSKRWPLYWLDRIAQVPQKNNTWFGVGDTLPAGNPPELLSDDFKTNHFILSEPILLKSKLERLTSANDVETRFLAVIPIFQNELDFKLRNSATILFRKFHNKGITEMIDTYRISCCRKRILGLF